MSTSVDNRVVSMRFDNKQFESGTKQSMSTLDKLKEKLNLPGASKGLEDVGEASKRVSFDGISRGVETVQVKFSALQVVAITALSNITNSAVNAGKNLVESLTIAPIKDGFDEYELKMGSIQTIMAGTGESLETVNTALAELNKYSDETIYSFKDMTNNIGKFTNSGISLKGSVASIKGISNVAALSGANTEEASRAMYNFAQALSQGSVKLMDWKSIENANMATVEFKRQLMDSAVAAGTLTTSMDGVYHTLEGDTITATEGFNQTLEQQWLTTDALVATLGRYADETTDIGARATKAAVEVKTFSQMLDTMKESVGSGWATTWEHILGNKDQSTKLFTDINNSFSSLIGPSTDARNAMLSFWNANGGRDAILEALSTAFQSLMGILSPIRKAFRDIFPVDTGERLVAISNGIRDLVNKFKIGETTSTNIGRAFKGLFAVLDVGVEVFKFVAKAIGLVIGAFMPGTGGLLGGLLAGTAGIGDFLVAIRNVIVDSNIFVKALEKIGIVMDYVRDTIAVATGVMSALFDKLKSIMSPYITNIKEAISTSTLFTDAIDGIKQMFDNLSSSGAASVSDKISSALSVLADMGEKVKESFSWVGPILDVILPKLEEIGGVLKEKLSPVLEFIWSKLKQLTLGDVGTLLAGGGLVMIGKSVKGLIDSVKGSLEPIQDITSGFKDVLGGITGSLEAFQTKLKADALLKIAAAIGILAVAIVMLSMIEPEALEKAIFALSIVIGELALSMSVLQKSSTGSKGLTGRLIALGIAILLLTKAVKTLGELDPDVLDQGVVALAAMLTTLGLFTKFTSGKGIETSMGSIVGLAIAILILTVAVKKFGEMDPDVLDQGTQGLAACLVSLALFMRLAGKPEHMVAIGLGMIGIATSMLIFASAIGKLGELSDGQLQNGLVGFGVILGEIIIMLHLLPDNTSMVKAAIGLGMIGGAMYIIAGAVALFGIMPIATIVQGLLALTIVLAEMTAAAILMKGTLSGAASMLIMAIAINMLVPAIALLGSLELKTIGIALLALAGIFAVLGLSALILAPLVPVIFGLALSILTLGVGLGLIGIGMMAFAAGLLAITAGGAPFVAAIIAIIMAIINLIPVIATKIGEGIQALAVAIMLALPVVLEALMALGEGLILVWTELIPPVIDALLTFILTMLAKLNESIPLMVQAAADIILGILKGINDNIQKIVEAAIDICINFINGIISKLPDIIDTAYKFIIGFIDGLAQAIENNHEALSNAVARLMNAIIDAIIDFIPKMLDVGKNIIKGIMKGFKSMGTALVDAAKGVVGDAVDGVKNFLGIESPSKVFAEIGMYSALGMAGGLEDYAGKVSTAATDVGVGAVDSLKNAMSNISDVVNGDIDMTPTIRPVLDLSDVTAGAGTINSMLGKNHGISVNSANNKISAINAGIRTNAIQNGRDVESNNPNQDQPIYVMVNVDNNMDSRQLTDTLTTKVTKAITKGQNSRNLARGVI